MIIYNKTWLANLRLLKEVKKEVQYGNITSDEFKTIKDKYHIGFYTSNFFVRIGLIVLTFVIVLFAEGLLSLMLSSFGIITSYGWLIFLGLVTYAIFELMLQDASHYQSGVDDALLFIAGCQVAAGFGMMLNGPDNNYIVFFAMVTIVGAYLTLRSADRLIGAITCLTFLGFVFFSWIKIIPAGLATAPFIMMLASGAAYWFIHKYRHLEACINYEECLLVIETVCLLVFYAAGNYYVIQNLSNEMAHKAGPVPFGWFFWTWTIGLPFVYLWIGIKTKNTTLWRVGLFLVAAGAATFRNYIHLMPPDVTLTLAGAALLAIALGISRYLKTPKHGFTTAEPKDTNLLDSLKVESLIIAEAFGHIPSAPAPADKGIEFGGGSFGGGGSSGNF